MDQIIITGKRIVDASWKHQPRKALGQLGMSILTTYVPFGSETAQFTSKDVGLVTGLINNFGLGYYYKFKSPRELSRLFLEAMDKSKTLSDQKQALNKFRFGLNRAYQALFDDKYKDLADQLEEAKEQAQHKPVR